MTLSSTTFHSQEYHGRIVIIAHHIIEDFLSLAEGLSEIYRLFCTPAEGAGEAHGFLDPRPD